MLFAYSLWSRDDDEDDLILNIKCHYAQASIVGCIFELGDSAYVKASYFVITISGLGTLLVSFSVVTLSF